MRKSHKRVSMFSKKLSKKTVAAAIAGVVLVGAIALWRYYATAEASYYGNTNPLRGTQMNIAVDNPFDTSPVVDFPDGISCIDFMVDLSKNGTPLGAERVSIQKPKYTIIDRVDIYGSHAPLGTENSTLVNDTVEGDAQYCLRGTRAMTNAQVTVKLARLTSVKRTFRFSFSYLKSNMVKNTTDAGSLRYDVPLQFSVKVPGWIANDLATAKVVYVYRRHVYSGFPPRWKDELRTINSNLTCDNEGNCTGTIDRDHTKPGTGGGSIVKGKFTYKFELVDKGDHKVTTRTISGTLK